MTMPIPKKNNIFSSDFFINLFMFSSTVYFWNIFK